jgi:hypothetical protein
VGLGETFKLVGNAEKSTANLPNPLNFPVLVKVAGRKAGNV